MRMLLGGCHSFHSLKGLRVWGVKSALRHFPSIFKQQRGEGLLNLVLPESAATPISYASGGANSFSYHLIGKSNSELQFKLRFFSCRECSDSPPEQVQ